MRDPKLTAQSHRAPALFKEGGKIHGRIVHTVHSARQADCALAAKDRSDDLCKTQRMPRRHPIRPYLRAWRTHFEMTAERLAGLLGMHHSTVIRQETGLIGVDDATFSAIADAYGISIAELSAAPADREKAQQLARLLGCVRHMDERGLRTLADLAEQIADKR